MQAHETCSKDHLRIAEAQVQYCLWSSTPGADMDRHGSVEYFFYFEFGKSVFLGVLVTAAVLLWVVQ